MNYSEWQKMTATDGDLVIERKGTTITKITKSGVVIWPQEGHTAPMPKDTPQYAPPPTTANSFMVGGDHYRTKDSSGTCPTCKNSVQHWDWAHNLRGLEYAATKYLARWREKDGLASLKKVIHYTQKLIEIHFPDVVVDVRFSNRTEGKQEWREGERDKVQSTTSQFGGEVLGTSGGRETQESAGMAGCQTTHSSAIDQCTFHWQGHRCTLSYDHEGMHKLG